MSTGPHRIAHVPAKYQLAAVLAGGVLVRLVLFASQPLTRVLERRPELTSPLTSVRSRESLNRHCARTNHYSEGGNLSVQARL